MKSDPIYDSCHLFFEPFTHCLHLAKRAKFQSCGACFIGIVSTPGCYQTDEPQDQIHRKYFSLDKFHAPRHHGYRCFGSGLDAQRMGASFAWGEFEFSTVFRGFCHHAVPAADCIVCVLHDQLARENQNNQDSEGYSRQFFLLQIQRHEIPAHHFNIVAMSFCACHHHRLLGLGIWLLICCTPNFIV